MYTLLLIAVTLVISLILTPMIIKVSIKFDLVDRPNFRKYIQNQFQYWVVLLYYFLS